MRMLRKASRGRENRRKCGKQLERERQEACVRTVKEGFSPTGKQGLSQDGAQVSAGPGEAVISCTLSVRRLCTCRETS